MGTMLIAEDNISIADILEEYGKKEGFDVILAKDGEEAIRFFNQCSSIEIVLLDVMMPKKDGFEVCREIRKTSEVPIIIITARGEDFERIMGLDIGADDYIVKPFSPGEVMARVRAILRRLKKVSNGDNQLTIDNLSIDLDQYQVTINNEPIRMTKKEIELLWVFANNKGIVYTRDHLLNKIWGYDYFGDNRTVDTHIKRLRNKIDVYEHPNWSIQTIWGVGYKFEVKDEA